MVVDFGELKRVLNEVLEELDHRFINELPPFDRLNPTSENIARWIFRGVKERISGMKGIWVSKVTVQESEGVMASYWE
jgi:6-pyruvoyltetrahydropterin/6-carboxytetrahydropterin synthase